MNRAKIRQQGFDDHGGGYKIYDNPFEKGFEHHYLWEEGWSIREAQDEMLEMFKDFDPAAETEYGSCRCASKTVCPHCGEEIKVVLE